MMLGFLFQLGKTLIAVRGQFSALDRRLHGATRLPGMAAVGETAAPGEAGDLREL